MTVSTNEAEQVVHNADDLAVIDTVNSILDRVEDLLLEGTSHGTICDAPAAESFGSGSLTNFNDKQPKVWFHLIYLVHSVLP